MTAQPNKPTPEQCRALLRYEPETGRLFWLPRPESMFTAGWHQRSWNTRYAGQEAFTATLDGYKKGAMFDRVLYAHHVAWAVDRKSVV